MKQTIISEQLTVNLHYTNQKSKYCPCYYEHTAVSCMGLAKRYVGKAFYYKHTRDQDGTSIIICF